MKKKKDIFEEILRDFERRMEEIIQTLEEPRNIKKQSFSIKIKPGRHGPEVRLQRFDGDKRRTQHLKINKSNNKNKVREVENFIEPVTKIVERGNRLMFEVSLPSVKMGDIEVNQLKRSIEVKGYTNDVGYFAILPVPRGYQIVRDEMSRGKYRIFVEV